MPNKLFNHGDKVIYTPKNEVYDFGYYSNTEGKCVIYEEGEHSMQDSYAVDIDSIKKK